MIPLLFREMVERPPVLPGWLALLLVANILTLSFFWKGRRHHGLAITAVIGNLVNVTITAGWFYFLLTWAFQRGDRALGWTMDPWLAGLALYGSLVILAILVGIAVWLVVSWRKRGGSLSSLMADLLPVLPAILIAVITVRVPFVVQAFIDRLP